MNANQIKALCEKLGIDPLQTATREQAERHAAEHAPPVNRHLAPLYAFFEEGCETKAGTVIEDAGWYYAFMGQMIGPFETEAEAMADAVSK